EPPTGPQQVTVRDVMFVIVLWSYSHPNSPPGPCAVPTTIPSLVTSFGTLDVAFSSLPMSVIVDPVRTNACCTWAAVSAQPTIVPVALIERASLSAPPRVPRSCIVPPLQRNARWRPAESFAQPTTWPVPFPGVA